MLSGDIVRNKIYIDIFSGDIVRNIIFIDIFSGDIIRKKISLNISSESLNGSSGEGRSSSIQLDFGGKNLTEGLAVKDLATVRVRCIIIRVANAKFFPRSVGIL
jgi:hypothetical protein